MARAGPLEKGAWGRSLKAALEKCFGSVRTAVVYTNYAPGSGLFLDFTLCVDKRNQVRCDMTMIYRLGNVTPRSKEPKVLAACILLQISKSEKIIMQFG